MDSSKIKNYVILLLAIVNIFLLAIVLKNDSEQRAAGEYAQAALKSALAKSGISISESVMLPDGIPTEITLSRSMLRERRNLSTLIGSCSVKDLGGNIISYEGSDGQASYRGTGEFEITMNSDIIPLTSDPVASCRTIAGKLGIACSDISPEHLIDSDKQAVTMTCSWDNTPIFNALIRFDFSAGSLSAISGMRPLDTVVSVRASDEYPDISTILMSFLGYIIQTGDNCSEITDVQLGYFITSSASGSCVLRPVWCIVTDTDKYYINGQTGKPESVEYAA